jgi:serine/threonine-protein kinase
LKSANETPPPLQAEGSRSSDSDYLQLKQWVSELLDLPHRERDQRLSAIVQRAPALADALHELLAAAEQPLAVLDRVVSEPVSVLMPAHYRMLRELGRGGMGVVWLAERRLDGVCQTVAVKQALHAQIDPRQRQLFERERSILAGLEHPHIARLLDAGVDARGNPYLTTAFIDGVDLDVHVSRQRPSLQQRLQLFLKIASAVAYAHRQMVVHCDLKPSNVMVDAQGEPHLLDFGVARLLAEGSDTRTIEQRLSLRYAAPESLAQPGARPGPGVDIHALGLLLYELLTGRSPYPRELMPAALLKAILHDEVEAPSRQRALRGVDADLDAIVAMALRKRPEDRYASVEALADDVRAWLSQRPVAARGNERGYQWRRFLRRRWPWLLVVAAALVAAGGLVVYEVQRTRTQLAALSLERDKALALGHYYEVLFSSARPEELQNDELSARELLRRSVEQMRSGLRAQMPDDARAALYRNVAGIMERQGLLPEAVELLEQATAVWRSLPAPPADQIAEALNNRAVIELRRGQPALALRFLQDAIQSLQDDGQRDTINLGQALQMRSVLEVALGREQEARVSLQDAMRILRQHDSAKPYMATAFGNLAMFELRGGEAEQALLHLDEGLKILAELKPERTQNVLSLKRARASALRELQRYDEALALYAEVERDTRRLLGETHPHVAESRHALGLLHLARGELALADAVLRDAQSRYEAIGGLQHPRALVALLDRVWVALLDQRNDDAREGLRDYESRVQDESALDSGSRSVQRMLRAQVACSQATGDARGDHGAPQAAASEAMRLALSALQSAPALPRRVRLAQAEAWAQACGVVMATP